MPVAAAAGTAIPWASILMAILSFIMTKKSGKSTGVAAAVAAGVGIGTYYLADPANPDNLFKIGVDTTKTADVAAPAVTLPSSTAPIAQGPGVIGTIVDTTGKVVSKIDPTPLIAGGVIGGAIAGVSKETWTYIIIGVGALLLLR